MCTLSPLCDSLNHDPTSGAEGKWLAVRPEGRAVPCQEWVAGLCRAAAVRNTEEPGPRVHRAGGLSGRGSREDRGAGKWLTVEEVQGGSAVLCAGKSGCACLVLSLGDLLCFQTRMSFGQCMMKVVVFGNLY